MADTAVAITAGTGTNIDTRTEATNGNHRQVFVVGDPSVNAGVAPVDATAGLKVDLGADNDVTITGTVPATQSGTWTVQPGNTANTTAWKVDGSAVTQPVSGTVTAAQSTIGNLKATVTLVDSGSTSMTNATAHALNVVAVDSVTGAATATAVARTTDTISAADATDALMNGTTALTPKFAKIAASSSGNNALVAAVTSKKIRVVAYSTMGNGAVNFKFQSDGAGTPVDLTGLKYVDAAGKGAVGPYCPLGLFESGSGKSLDLNLSAAIAVGGELTYVEV